MPTWFDQVEERFFKKEIVSKRFDNLQKPVAFLLKMLKMIDLKAREVHILQFCCCQFKTLYIALYNVVRKLVELTLLKASQCL